MPSGLKNLPSGLQNLPSASSYALRPWADFGGPWARFFPESLGQGLDFVPKWVEAKLSLQLISAPILNSFTPSERILSARTRTRTEGGGELLRFKLILADSALLVIRLANGDKTRNGCDASCCYCVTNDPIHLRSHFAFAAPDSDIPLEK